MVSLRVTLPDWLNRAALSRNLLTLMRIYFSIRRPLERRIFQLCRKHCGNQRARRLSPETLLKKSGSTSPRRAIEVIRKRVEVLEPGHGRGAGVLVLKPGTPEVARAAAPGWDIWVLEAVWRDFAAKSPPKSVDAAFLG